VGLEPTTRGLKGAGTQCVEVRGRPNGLMSGHGRVSKSGAVAVSAAVKLSEGRDSDSLS
jgi:hypothetical protein